MSKKNIFKFIIFSSSLIFIDFFLFFPRVSLAAPVGANTQVCTGAVNLTGNGTGKLNWSVTGVAQDGYLVQIDNNNDFSSPEIDTGVVSSANLSHLFSGLGEGIYYWRVAARATASGSYYWTPWAVGDSAFTIVGAPSNLTANAIECARNNLSWQDNSNYEDGFDIERSVNIGEPNLVSLWRMNNNWQDSKGTNHGLVSNWMNEGKLNGALGFDGVNDYVSVSDFAGLNFGSGDFSIEYWVNWNQVTAANSILGQSTGGGANTKWMVTRNGRAADSMTFHFYDGSNHDLNFAWTPAANTWYHHVFTRTGYTYRFYVDGVQAGGDRVDATAIPNIAANLIIGNDGAFEAGYMKGLIDEVRVYNTVLSQANISALYNSGSGTETPASGAVSGWHLNETSGISVANYIGSNTGTLNNFALGPTFGTPKYGAAAGSFDGNDYVGKDSGVSGIGGTTQMTYEAWVKRSGINTYQQIYVLGPTAGYNYQMFRIENTNQIRADFGNEANTNYRVLVTTNTLTDTTSWHHIVATYNAGTIHVYVDNVEWTGTYYGTWTGAVVAPTTLLKIGNTFNGLIDEVAVYNIALSAATIASHYKLATVGPNVTTYSNTNLPKINETYYYRVKAYDTGGDFAYSNQASAIISFISSPTASNLSVSQSDIYYCAYGAGAVLSWTFSDPDIGDSQSAYQIQVDNNSDFSSPEVSTDKILNSSNSYNISPGVFTYNTAYYWRLKVFDQCDKDSDWINGSSFTTRPFESPTVDFNWFPSMPSINERVTFTDTSVLTGALVSRLWTFSANVNLLTSPAIDQTEDVKFNTSGPHSVTLTIKDSLGYTCSKTKNVSTKLLLPSFKEIKPE